MADGTPAKQPEAENNPPTQRPEAGDGAPTKPLEAVGAELETPLFWGVAAFLLVALGYLTVAGCLRSPFTTYDDLAQIIRNPLLFADRSYLDVFTTPYYGQYVPVTLATFKLNLALFGRDAAASFRAVNWLIHAGSGLLLLLLLVRLGLRRLEALFVAAAWVVHPTACESVAWITERSNCLAAFFGLAGLWAYTKWYGRWPGVVGGTLGFLLALLGKPAALGWLPVFVGLEMLGGPQRLANGTAAEVRKTPGGWVGAGLRLLPLAVLAGVFTVVGLRMAHSVLLPPPGGSLLTGLMTDTEILARYLGNIFLPVRLSAFYGVEDIASLGDPRLYLYGALLAGVVGGSTWVARSRRRALFGWVWFFGALGPTANLVAITYTMQDRYIYLSLMGVLLVAVETVQGLAARLGARTSTSATGAELEVRAPRALTAWGALAVVLMAGLIVLTAARSFTWDSTLGLYAEAVERQPRCGLARIYHGGSLMQAAEALRVPGPQVDPRQTRMMFFRCTAQALNEYEAAEGLPDTYRFYDPLGARVAAARAAVRLGCQSAAETASPHPPAQQEEGDERPAPGRGGSVTHPYWERAQRALARVLPLTPPPDGEGALTEKEKAQGFGALRHGGINYLYRRNDVGEAYSLLAQAGLLQFLDPATPPEVAWTLPGRMEEAVRQEEDADRKLEEEMKSSKKTVRGRIGGQLMRVALSLIAEALGPPGGTGSPGVELGPGAPGSPARLEQARALVRPVLPVLEDYRYQPAIVESLLPPVAPGRAAALGQLARAEVELRAAQMPKLELPRAVGSAESALALARKAVALDPAFAEGLWVQARAHLLLDQLCEKAGDLPGSRAHFAQAKELLQKVPASSPRYELVQQTLQTLTPPPEPGPPPPGAGQGPHP